MSTFGLIAGGIKALSNKAGLEIGLRRIRRSSPQQRFIYFLHIGKAAGSQIKQAMVQINEQQSAVTMLAMSHQITLKDIPEPADYFFSVREPISRFRSGFYSRKRRGQPLNNIPWTRYEEQAFATFPHANDLAEALFAPGERGLQALGAMKSIEHTAEDQIDWFVLAGDIFSVRPPVWILRQEHLEADFQTFLERAGVTFKPELRQDPVGAHRNDYSQIPALSERAESNLRRWYAQDFAFYDAVETWLELQSSPRDGHTFGSAPDEAAQGDVRHQIANEA